MLFKELFSSTFLYFISQFIQVWALASTMRHAVGRYEFLDLSERCTKHFLTVIQPTLIGKIYLMCTFSIYRTNVFHNNLITNN